MMIRKPNLRYDRMMWVMFLFIVVMIWMTARRNKKEAYSDGIDVVVNPLASGDKLISERDVKQALLISFGNTFDGTEIGDVQVEQIEKVLEADPFVADAETYIDQNNKIHVKIDQREPVLRILDNNSGNYYLDTDGKKMPPSKNFAARVIVATGNIAPYREGFMNRKRSTLKDLFTLTQTILNDEFLSGFVQQIHVNNANEFVLVPLIGDQIIQLGTIRRLDDKIKRLKVFYKQGMPYEGWRKYESISLKYNGQVVCRK